LRLLASLAQLSTIRAQADFGYSAAMRALSKRVFETSSPWPRACTLGVAAGALFALACGSADTASLERSSANASTTPAGSEAAPSVEPGTSSGLAEDPPLLGGACTGQVAEQTFAAALCSCEDTNIAGYLRTRGLGDSDDAPDLVGSVGVNRNYSTNGYANVGGSFTVAGTRDVTFGGLLQAGQDLFFHPAADVAGVVRVGRDAWLADDLRAFGRVAIARDLYTADGAGFRGIALVDVGGARHTQDVSIGAPCGCGAGEIIDVASLVEDARSDNDNAAIGLDPDALDVTVGIGTALELPTGRFYVNQIGGIGGINLRVTGKTALFVGDDLLATGAFRIELGPDAEIDLFVRGNLALTGAALFGDRARPAATRIYVGGSGDVTVAGYSAFVGNLYAPTADITIGGYGQIYGSLFGKNINAAGFLSVGYDSAIGDTGQGCPPNAADVPRIR
jgi:hypothetical protein